MYPSTHATIGEILRLLQKKKNKFNTINIVMKYFVKYIYIYSEIELFLKSEIYLGVDKP